MLDTGHAKLMTSYYPLEKLRKIPGLENVKYIHSYAVRYTLGMLLIILPKTTVIGDIIAYANYMMVAKEGRRNRYTFAGSEYFKRMQGIGLYSIDAQEIKNRIDKLGLTGVVAEKIV